MIKKTEKTWFHEDPPILDSDCFIIIERFNRVFDFPLHVHLEYELNFIKNGKGTKRIVGDSIELISDYEMVLITQPLLEHAWLHQGEISNPSNIYEITVQFEPSLLSDTLLQKHIMNGIRLMFERAKRGLLFSKECIKSIEPLLKTLLKEKGKYQSFITLLLILEKLSLDKNAKELSSVCFDVDYNQYHSRRVRKIYNYMLTHYTEEMYVAELAELVNMSISAFNKFFKKRTTKSLSYALNEIRISKAISKLINTELSISEIAYSCGFNNISNFNRIFKKYKLITPAEFKNQYK